jgi:hypothetical protein
VKNSFFHVVELEAVSEYAAERDVSRPYMRRPT